MKKPLTRLLAAILATLLLCTTLPLMPHAAEDLSPAFTDAAFLAAIRMSLQIAPSAPITAAQASTVTHLYVPNRGIASLAGIEHLTNLLVFDVSGNALTAIDFSTNPTLIRIDVSGNPLVSLNVRQNQNLTQLNAAATELTALDVTQNAKLRILFVPGNPRLSALNVRSNPALTDLNAAYCGLTALDISQNLNLVVLIASNNQLQSLALGNQDVLQVLDVADNQISSLNLAGLRDLAVLTVENNLLSTLNTSQNLGLMYLVANGNKLTGLNLTNQMLLLDLRVSDNNLSVLSVTGNPMLQRLEAANNRLNSLDVTANGELVTLNVAGNQLPTIDLSKNWRLYSLDVSANQLAALNLTGLNRLRELDVSNNKLPSKQAITGLVETALYTFVYHPQTPYGTDITAAFTDPNLLAALRSVLNLGENGPIMQAQAAFVMELDLDGWDIESLDGLEYFTNLQSLSLAYNNLSQQDFSFLPKLKELDVSGNQLASLIVTGNPALERLWCSDNLLEQLDLRKNPVLRTLNCSGNLLGTLWLAENPALQSLNASHNLLQNLDLTNNGSIRSLDVRYNFIENESVLLRAPGAFFTTYRFDPQNSLDMDVTEYFTDPAFLAVLRGVLGKSADASVFADELRTITTLDASGQGITSVAGLAFLTNLVWLDVSNNKITGMDISNHIKLNYLDARLNWMEEPAAIFGLRESITTEIYFSPQKFSGVNITDAFPDENFLAALREAMGKGPDDPIGSIDCAATETLELQNRNIQSVAGIEYFTGLQTLNLADNPIQSLDLSRNTSLKHLNASGLFLDALSLAANVMLETLDVSRNHLTALNLLANRNLTSVNASYNFISSQSLVRLPSSAPQLTFSKQCDCTSKPATCTAGGYETWTCVHNPAHTLTVNQVPTLGHLYQSTVTKPTFTQGGYTTHTCSRCHDSYVDTYTDKITIPPYSPTLTLNYHQACSIFSDIARVSPDMQWKSSNEKVLKIDGKGLVTYPKLARGNTTITGTLDGVTYVTANVTVKITFWQWLLIIFLFGWIWY